MSRYRQFFDRFALMIIGAVIIAAIVPARGAAVDVFDALTASAIGLLFFFHGARLERRAIVAGIVHWRLQLAVMVVCFVVFPLIVVLSRPALVSMLGESFYPGVLYLALLPGTVQSAIAFTAIARGNVAAAVCSASASSLIGVFLTPFLVKVLLGGEGSTVEAIGRISVQILLPFIAGHLARPLIGSWVDSHRRWLKVVDQGSILLVVYTAFSAAMVARLWATVEPRSLVMLCVVCLVLLLVVLLLTWGLGRALGFSLPDRVTLLFAGSKKSLATGAPMAQVLFAGGGVGLMLIPIMVFHQIQLMVCAVLAQRFAMRDDASRDDVP
jgi:solute carrier family 10 (sodium/bile acid cotransporter), member 7